MKRKLSLCVLLGSALTLSGCASLLDKIPGGELIKKLDVLNFISDEPGTTNQTGGNNNNNNSSNAGGQTQSGSLLDTLKSMAKPIAAKMLGKSESSITFSNMNDEDSEGDVYYYESSSITYVDIYCYKESFDQAIDRLIGYLPSGVVAGENYDDLTDEYGLGEEYYDRCYTLNEYTYEIVIDAFDDCEIDGTTFPAETYEDIYIFKTSQQSAFDALFEDAE